jgi:transmembrane sensor
LAAPAEPVPAFDSDSDVEPREERSGRRRFLWAGSAIAASLTLAVIGWQVRVPEKAAAQQRVETALGEIRQVAMTDGSRASVNTGSVLEVDYTLGERAVRLENGEAWFEVAKDKARPFVVSAGDVRVRAVGTAFSVQRVTGGADIRVTEGTVEVWSIGQESLRLPVRAGARAFVAEVGGPQSPVADALGNDRKLAWREGALKFEGDTLAAAAAEFNRYNRIKLEIAPALSDEKVVGRFRIDEPDAFARAASTMFDARVERARETIRIARHGRTRAE